MPESETVSFSERQTMARASMLTVMIWAIIVAVFALLSSDDTGAMTTALMLVVLADLASRHISWEKPDLTGEIVFLFLCAAVVLVNTGPLVRGIILGGSFSLIYFANAFVCGMLFRDMKKMFEARFLASEKAQDGDNEEEKKEAS